MTRPMTLAQRRRTAGTPEMDALEKVLLWLDAHRNHHRLVPDGDHHVYLARRTTKDPWAEIATFPSVIAFGRAYGLVDPRSLP